MKKIFITVCILAIATPFAEITIEGFKNQGALWITVFVAGIGLLGICVRNIMFPKINNQYQYDNW